MATATRRIITPGDQGADKGTTPWADWQRSRLRHALKDVHFEARQIVQIIRDMCGGRKPAWHLMTRKDGVGFRTFEELVTTPEPEGLGFPDYAKFRGMAVSEPGVMNEREFDLLTAAPDQHGARNDLTSGTRDRKLGGERRVQRLRRIGHAPALIRRLYVEGLVSAKMAELMGPDERMPGYEDRKRAADSALAKIQHIARNGSAWEYRQQVNAAIRSAFQGRDAAKLSLVDRAEQFWNRMSKREQDTFIARIGR